VTTVAGGMMFSICVREELHVQSAALLIDRTEEMEL
jgi:hypothetical protein